MAAVCHGNMRGRCVVHCLHHRQRFYARTTTQKKFFIRQFQRMNAADTGADVDTGAVQVEHVTADIRVVDGLLRGDQRQ